MRVLLTGVSGYVGSALVPRLRGEGHSLRGYGRSAARVSAAVDEIVEGDAVLGTGLAEALDGVEVAYYLIHSMETLAGGAFAERELRAAERGARQGRPRSSLGPIAPTSSRLWARHQRSGRGMPTRT